MIDKLTEENLIKEAIETADALRWAAETKAVDELKQLQKKDSRYLDPMTAYKFLKESLMFVI